MDNYWIICPYCLYEHGDAWEWHLDDGEPEDDDYESSFECEGCGERFIAYKHEIVQYYAKPYVK